MQRQRGYSRNKPLADLLLALPGLATRPITAELQQDLERMAHDIRRVDFRAPPRFSGFRIHTFGLWRRRGSPFPEGGRSLVMSPFLVGSTVRDLVRDHGLDVLISRPEAFEDVVRGAGREALPRTCYVLSPGADLNARDAEEGKEQPDSPQSVEAEDELEGLHAKLFLFENGRETRLFTGSANATSAAFHVNVEVLIELVGKTKDCGIAPLLGLEDDPRIETLRSLLQEYHPPDRPEPPSPGRRLERQADRLARILAATPFTATVRDMDSEQRWDVTLSGGLPELPVGAEVKVWPATLPSEAAQKVGKPAGPGGRPEGWTDPMDTVAIFTGMSFEALTAFFAFEVLLREEQHEARKRFTVTTELVGAPDNRNERLLQSLLKDRRRVLQLLFLILMGEGADASAFVQAAHRDGTTSQGSFGGWDQAALLEALLRCLSRNPERIDDVARLISDLERTPEGQDLLPEGMKEIWEPVWTAREALRS